MLAQIFLWKPVYQRMGAIFQMCWREVASSRDLPIMCFVSLLRHLFLAGRMRVFGSQPDSHEPGPAPKHLGQGHVRQAAHSRMPWQLGSCGQAAPCSVEERPALRRPRCRIPQLLQGHFYPCKNIPPHPGPWQQVTCRPQTASLDSSHPSSISRLLVPSSPEMLIISCQTQRASSHRAAEGCLTARQRIALPRRRSKEPASFRELRIIKGNRMS